MKAKTQKRSAYRMPAEWEPHEATWLSWPKDPDTYPPGIIEKVEETFAQMVIALQENERVNILVNDSGWEGKARKVLEREDAGDRNVRFFHIKSADIWVRDYAPIFVKDKGGVVLPSKWVYNAYGNKYEDLLYDNQTGESIARMAGQEILKPGIVLEGGSVDVNGDGRMLTTEQCLLNRNRNPQLSKTQIEGFLSEYLGASDIIWLKKGIEGDDTDGHVDDISRFVGKKTVVTALEENARDENYVALKDNLDILRGLDMEIIELPMPKKLEIPERRLPVSYANFYIANRRVLLPVFGDNKDGEATDILQTCFPDREVIPIYARDLVYGYGGIHCATMQQPV
jgi:agmatine deiminase